MFFCFLFCHLRVFIFPNTVKPRITKQLQLFPTIISFGETPPLRRWSRSKPSAGADIAPFANNCHLSNEKMAPGWLKSTGHYAILPFVYTPMRIHIFIARIFREWDKVFIFFSTKISVFLLWDPIFPRSHFSVDSKIPLDGCEQQVFLQIVGLGRQDLVFF